MVTKTGAIPKDFSHAMQLLCLRRKPFGIAEKN